MERNTDDTFTSRSLGQSGQSAAAPGGFGASASPSGSTDDFERPARDMGSAAREPGSEARDAGSAGAGAAREGAREVANETSSRFQQAKSSVGERLGTLKEKASHLNTSLADKLEAGAEKLRQRGAEGGNLAYAGGATAATTASTDNRVQQATETLASGLQKSAEFLREGDIKATIEEQVKEHPGRTLLIALGVGYVLGKALRR